MPIFDDPRRELRRLEEELLAEEREEEYEEFGDYGFEEYDEDAELLAQAKALIGDEAPPVRRRNPAVDFNRTVYADEEFDEDDAVLVKKRKKEKGIGGLLFLAILELMGILGIVGWWILWLL